MSCRRHRRWAPAAVLVVLAFVATSCGEEGKDLTTTTAPIAIQEGPDGAAQITLTDAAAERLNIELGNVMANGDGLTVPRAAVIIDPDGSYWVYTNPEPLVFMRQELKAVDEDEHHAFFSEGPRVGTAVVVTGVPELYGAEFGIGK